MSAPTRDQGVTSEDLDRSVTCYFCGGLWHGRDCIAADDYNAGDGGSVCPDCIERGEFVEVEGSPGSETGHLACPW